jgi:hypothetical protein
MRNISVTALRSRPSQTTPSSSIPQRRSCLALHVMRGGVDEVWAEDSAGIVRGRSIGDHSTHYIGAGADGLDDAVAADDQPPSPIGPPSNLFLCSGLFGLRTAKDASESAPA